MPGSELAHVGWAVLNVRDKEDSISHETCSCSARFDKSVCVCTGMCVCGTKRRETKDQEGLRETVDS